MWNELEGLEWVLSNINDAAWMVLSPDEINI